MGNPVLPVLADYARTILQNSIADPLARGSGLLSMIASRWAGKEDPAGYGKAAEEEARNLYGYRPKYPETVDALGLMEKTAIGQLSKMPELIQQRTEQINPELGYGGRQIAELAPYFMGLYGGPKAKYFPKYGRFSNMADRMERFEISDRGLKIKQDAFKFTPEGYDKNLMKITEKYSVNKVPLEEVIDAPALFKQYPFSRKIPVSSTVEKGLPSEIRGGAFSEEGITARADNFKELKSNLLHEIQHAIQEREGFAKGGSPEQIAINPDYFSQNIKKLQNEVNTAALKTPGRLGELAKKYWDKGLRGAEMFEYENLTKQLPEWKKLYGAKKEWADKFSPYEGYKRLAGEIEARDAASRMNLTGKQRRKTSPYTGENIPLSEWITRRH